ncbi:MAG: YdbH domain-containing protein [Candidatus Omnitrophica bacterium]|nr:YdbH domain-containing protein [Candidatus Omnitrophota bacterium]
MPRHLFSKIFFVFIIFILILSVGVYFFAKPILLPIANKELQKIFKESSVADFRLTRDFIEFKDIKIKPGAGYDFRIKEARIYYDLESLFNKKIEKVLLNDVFVKANIDKDNLSGIFPFPVQVLSENNNKFSIVKFEAVNVYLDVIKDDIKIKVKISAQLDMPEKKIDYIKLNIESLYTNLFQVEGIVLNAVEGQDTGEFYIRSIRYDQLKVGDIIGKSELKGKLLRISPLLVSLLGGNVKGEFNITLDQDMVYNLSLNMQGMEIKRFVDEMKFNEKFNMTGRLGGAFYISGKGQDIKDIKGDFNTDAPGGVFIIKDKTFLENVAKQSNQSLDIIVESFKNYNYNNGIITIGMESGNLAMNLQLDGKTGKRSLTMVLHDFNNGKEKP